jgi:hypothetical protein
MGLDEMMVGFRGRDEAQRLAAHRHPLFQIAAVIFAPGGGIKEIRARITGGELPQVVDIGRLSRRHEVMRQKRPHPGVAGFGIARQPDDPPQIAHSRYP